jgi:hypothetical protein
MKITLIFTKEQLEIINNALLETPTKYGAPLIQDINSQIQRQFDAAKGDEPTGQKNLKMNLRATNESN